MHCIIMQRHMTAYMYRLTDERMQYKYHIIVLYSDDICGAKETRRADHLETASVQIIIASAEVKN